jgi:ribosomal protein S18 acetylase RimI-like enzyme
MKSIPKPAAIIIREATIEDAHILSIAASEFFRDAFADKMSRKDLDEYLSTSLTHAVLEEELQDKRNVFVLAFSDDTIIGYSKLTTNLKLNIPNHDVELDRLYIQKTWHSKGVGSMLMEHCLHFSVNLGHRLMALAVWERNEQALHFYKRWGFIVTGDQIFMRGNDPQRGLLLTKDLNP